SLSLVSVTSSNPRLVTAESIIVNDGAQKTVAVAPVAGESGIAAISITLTDGHQTAVRVFELFVYDPAKNLKNASTQGSEESVQNLHVQRTESTVQLSWTARAGLRFAVEVSSDLSRWTALAASLNETTPGQYTSEAYLKQSGSLYVRVREIRTGQLSAN
ncbi:MAG: hypothetical protein ACK4UN_18105, partial [Limisphaerales bacterium]